MRRLLREVLLRFRSSAVEQVKAEDLRAAAFGDLAVEPHENEGEDDGEADDDGRDEPVAGVNFFPKVGKPGFHLSIKSL